MSVSGGSEVSVDKFEHSLLLKLPKFSKGFTVRDFVSALEGYVEKCDIRVLGRMRYPNEWNLTLASKEPREKLLQASCITVKGKKCVIHPLAEGEVRGKIHWLPGEIDDSKILEILNRFGEVLSFEKDMVFRSPAELRSSVRSFSLQIGPNVRKEDIPHFIHISKYEGLVTIKGRDPICLGCKELGHRKSKCPKSSKNAPKASKQKNKKPTANTAKSHAPGSGGKKGKKKAQANVHAEAGTSGTASGRPAAADTGSGDNLEESINTFILRISDTLHKFRAAATATTPMDKVNQLNAAVQAARILEEDETKLPSPSTLQNKKSRKKNVSFNPSNTSAASQEPFNSRVSVSQQTEINELSLAADSEQKSRFSDVLASLTTAHHTTHNVQKGEDEKPSVGTIDGAANEKTDKKKRKKRKKKNK